MDPAALRQRLAETEDQIANGERQIAEQRKLVVELDGNGQPAAHAKYCRFRLAFSRALEGRNRWLEDGRGRRAAAHLLTRDEARCIAGVHRKAPELLRKREATAAAPGRRDEGTGDAPDTVALAALYHRAGAAMTDTIGTIIAFLFFVIVVELGLIIFGRPRRERPERHALATWYFEEEPGRRSAARLILNFLSGQ